MSNGFVLIVSVIAFGGSWLVKRWLDSTYRTWSRVPNSYGVTGAQTADAILRLRGVSNVKIEQVKGRLTDHFDPARDILRLSQTNYSSTSVAAMAVSAHEAGHAIQDHRDDIRLRLRKYFVPFAAFGGRFSPWLVGGGFIFGSDFLLRLGAWMLVGTLVFQLLTLPVEFNASKRALANLEELGLTDPEQLRGTRRVLTAAALTYVAAAATSIAYVATLWAITQGRRLG
ncbi:MAG: zinc metallopeptidase [Actinomycetota bacterium]